MSKVRSLKTLALKLLSPGSGCPIDGQRLLFLHSISDCNGFLCQENPFFSFRF